METIRPNYRLAVPAAMMVGLATLVAPLHGQGSPGPVHLPDATNAPAAAAPAGSPLNSNLTAPPAQTAPGWLQPPATPGATPPVQPAPSRGPAGDIHDIRGPISIPYEWFLPATIALGLLVMAGLFALWKFFPRRLLVHVKSPYEIALERLDAARSLMKTETVREYAFTVSEVIRVYIEQRFHEVAARRTTEEFIADLLGQSWSPLAAHRGRLEDFLKHCDLIKFARWGATTREMELMQDSARAFILETQPRKDKPEPVPGADNPPPAPQQPELAQAK